DSVTLPPRSRRSPVRRERCHVHVYRVNSERERLSFEPSTYCGAVTSEGLTRGGTSRATSAWSPASPASDSGSAATRRRSSSAIPRGLSTFEDRQVDRLWAHHAPHEGRPVAPVLGGLLLAAALIGLGVEIPLAQRPPARRRQPPVGKQQQ